MSASAFSSGVDGARRRGARCGGAGARTDAGPRTAATAAAVDLAADGERDLVDDLDVTRDHVRRERVSPAAGDPVSGELGIGDAHDRGQLRHCAPVDRSAAGPPRPRVDPAMRLRAASTSPSSIAVAADLDAVIGASDELTRAVGQVADQIAGAVPGAAVVFDEALRGQVGSATVTAGDAPAAEPTVRRAPSPGSPYRPRPTTRQALLGSGAAVGHRSPVRRQRHRARRWCCEWRSRSHHPGRRTARRCGLRSGRVPFRCAPSHHRWAPPAPRTADSRLARTSASISSQPGMKCSTVTPGARR